MKFVSLLVGFSAINSVVTSTEVEFDNLKDASLLPESTIRTENLKESNSTAIEAADYAQFQVYSNSSMRTLHVTFYLDYFHTY
jgi:hypothetical protein